MLSIFSLSPGAKSQGSIMMSDKLISYALPEDTLLKKRLAQAENFNTLASGEREIAYYLNYARTNPGVFLEKAINVFLLHHPEVKSRYTTGLQELFKTLTPLPVVLPDAEFSKVARSHANDLKSHRVLSHQSSNGKSFQQRVQAHVKGCGSECIHASERFHPLEAVLSLLFDFNVPDLGHRKSMLNPQFTRGGFGVAPDPKGNTIAVIDFSCL